MYKWVDKEGNVHFTDKKPETVENVQTGDTSATVLNETHAQAARRRSELLNESAEGARAAQNQYEKERSAQRAKNKENQADA